MLPTQPIRRIDTTLAALTEATVVAVIRESEEKRARMLAEGLIEAGIRALEITVSTPGCYTILRELVARGASKTVTLGAGTAKREVDVARAAEAGASFIVSPHFDASIIEAAHRAECVAIPGAMTPTEIFAAHEAGAEFVKVFPVSAMGGARYLRLIRGPLPEVRLWVSGNVGLEEIGDMIEAGAALVGLTSALTADLGDDPVPALRARVARAHEAKQVARHGRWLVHVRGPLSIVKIGLAEIRALPSDEHVSVESLVAGRRGQAVRVRRFLEGAGISPESEVELASEDGSFRRRVPARAVLEGGLLHFATDGQPLDRAMGGPIRLYIVGGAAGCDNVKALSQITFVSR